MRGRGHARSRHRRRPGGARGALSRKPRPHGRPLRADRAGGVRGRTATAAPPVRVLRRPHTRLCVHHARAGRAEAPAGRPGARAPLQPRHRPARRRRRRAAQTLRVARPRNGARVRRRVRCGDLRCVRDRAAGRSVGAEPRARRGGVQHRGARGDAPRDVHLHRAPPRAREAARPALRAPRRDAAEARSGRDPGRARDARRAARRDPVRLGQRVRRARGRRRRVRRRSI